MKLSKKILSLIMAAITVVTTLAVGSVSAFAAGWTSSAKSISPNKMYSGSASDKDIHAKDGFYKDAYKFTLPEKGKITLNITSKNPLYTYYTNTQVYIYKTSDTKQPIWYNHANEDSFSTGNSKGDTYVNCSASLSKGTYYMLFCYMEESVEIGDYNGKYNFKLSYTPSPSVAKTTVKKLTPKKNGFSITWKKCSGVTGYQLQYSTNKNMKSAKSLTVKGSKTTSKSVSKLKKKKTYYVRVRTYKTVKVNGKNKNYYSKWTSVKKVKTK